MPLSMPVLTLFPWLQAVLGCILILNLGLLAAERQQVCIRLLALQGAAISLLPLLMEWDEATWTLFLLTIVFLSIKGVILPYMLRRTHQTLPPTAPVPPYLGYSRSVLSGLMGYAFALWLAAQLPSPANELFLALFAPAFGTILTGLLLIVARRKALTQIMGYLVMENGIFLLGVPLVRSETYWLELTVMLDIWVGIFVMVLAVHHLNRALQTTDVDRIHSLRD
jgi:Hydrogenase 4 membrane component (E)